MKTAKQILRGVVVAAVTYAALFCENSAKAYVVPRSPEMVVRPSRTVAPAVRLNRQPIEGWMGPTRQATIWR